MNLLYTLGLTGVPTKLSVERSPDWEKLEKAHLLLEPVCQACGKKTKLTVHHFKPVHLFPQYELDPENLITLCENTGFNCHFFFGHLLNWANFVPNTKAVVAYVRSNLRIAA